jgi:hypothetical protein
VCHGEVPVPRRGRPLGAAGSGGFSPSLLGHPTGVVAAVRRPDPNYAQVGPPHYPLGRIEIPGGARTPPPSLFDDLR